MDFLLGIACGIVVSLIYSFGPAFFSMLHTSIHYGFRNASPFAFGVSLSDVITVSLLLTVLSGIDMEAVLHNVYVVTIGGSVLLGFAVYFFTRKSHDAEDSGSVMWFKKDVPKWYSVYLRGFLISFFNPLVWIYWLSIITLASGSFGVPTNHLFLFFGGVLLTTVSMDVLKCKVASMLQRFLTAHVLNVINKVVGIILLGFAIYLVVSLLLYLK